MRVAQLGQQRPRVSNIKCSKDRGKDVASAPWYHLFNGDRINDHYLTIEEKQKALKQNS